MPSVRFFHAGLALSATFVIISCAAPSIVKPSQTTMHSRLIGACVHTVSDETNQPKVFAAIAQSKLNSVREDLPWKYVEKSRGVYDVPPAWDQFVDTAIAKGLTPILILDYGNPLYDGGDKPRSTEAVAAFARYATFMVKHFRSKVKFYEVWNEWDNNTGGFPAATPEDYAALFKVVFPMLKQADPSATILVGAGIKKPQYYEKLAQAGVVKMADGIAIHPYNSDPIFGPEISTDLLRSLEKRMVELSGRPEVAMYVTEIGWPTNVGTDHVVESRQAEYAYQTVVLLSSLSYVKGIWWYDLRDDGQNENSKEDRLGLLHYDWSSKPAWASYNSAITFVESRELSFSEESKPSVGRVVINVQNPDQTKSILVWNFHNSQPSIYPACVPGKGIQLSAVPSKDAAPITGVTIVKQMSGSCEQQVNPVKMIQ